MQKPPGMRAYSTDLKERLVRAVAAGKPKRELARRFGVAVNTVKRAVVQARETGSLERKPIPGCPRRITHTALTRRYGWAPHDQQATGSVPRNHGKNTALAAALTPDGLHEPWLIEGAMDTPTFVWYIEEQLAPPCGRDRSSCWII